MLEIFDATSKVASHINIAPGLTQNSLTFWFDHLVALEQDIPSSKVIDENAPLSGFLRSRFMRYDNSAFKQCEVLLPILDMMNHHSASPGLERSASTLGQMPGLIVKNSKPERSSAQAMWCYSNFDALSAVLTYGFVDRSVNWTRSVPTHISLEGFGDIRIMSSTEVPEKKDIPEFAKDLKFFYPRIGYAENGSGPVISFLIIPGNGAPRSLRRILEIAVRIYLPDLRDIAEIERRVASLEEQLLAANEQFYAALQETAAAHSTDEIVNLQQHTMLELVQHQTAIIQQYREFSADTALQYLNIK